MVYLDFLLFTIIIILLCFLFNRWVDKQKNQKKEGFSHKGQSFLASTVKVESVIKSAEYGNFGEGWSEVSGWDTSQFKRTGVVDVKDALDKLIKKGTKEIVATNEAFGIVDPSPGKDKYLVIKFNKPSIVVSDARMQIPDYTQYRHLRQLHSLSNGYVWMEGDSVSLKFGNYEAEPFWVTVVKALYKIADLIAMIVIYDQMMKVAQSILKQMFRWWKWGFDQWVAIIKDLPGFFKEQFANLINFIQDAITNIFSVFETFFNLFMTIFNTLIQLPMQIFSMLEQIGTVIANLFTILINIPTAALNMIISGQEIMLDIMNKTPTIPFMDMFFQ
jgi:hypothetical protein